MNSCASMHEHSKMYFDKAVNISLDAVEMVDKLDDSSKIYFMLFVNKAKNLIRNGKRVDIPDDIAQNKDLYAALALQLSEMYCQCLGLSDSDE